MNSETVNKIGAYIFLGVALGAMIFTMARGMLTQKPKNIWLAPDGQKYQIEYCGCNTPKEQAPQCGELRYVKPEEGFITAGIRAQRVNGDDIAEIIPHQNFDCEAVQASWRFVKL